MSGVIEEILGSVASEKKFGGSFILFAEFEIVEKCENSECDKNARHYPKKSVI